MKFKLHNAQIQALRAAEAMSSAAWAEKLWDSRDMVDGYLLEARKHLTEAISELADFETGRVTPATAKVIELPVTQIDELAGAGAMRI